LHNCRSASEIERDFTALLGQAQDISLIGKRPAKP
jgi:hypothetical protein